MGARLGQHFLTSRAALGKIVEAAQLTKADVILEIGPGKGPLTEALLATGAHVVAIEKDERLARELTQKFSGNNRIRILEGDIRDFDPAGELPETYIIVANIPYYITGLIIRQFLTTEKQPSRMVLLTQKEVAERIARSPKESLLSLSVKAYGEPNIIARVPRGAFNPPPTVDSAILRIDNISRKHFESAHGNEETFFNVLHAGFAQKRKMLLPNLAKKYDRDNVTIAFQRLGVSSNARAEDIGIDTWLTLSRLLG